MTTPAVDQPVGAERWTRWARGSALAAATALPLMELLRIVALADPGDAVVAACATAIALPIHLRHVASALVGRAADHGLWSLGVLALVSLGAVTVLGTTYTFSLTSLVVSCLLVLRVPWSYLAAAAVVAVGFVVALLTPGAGITGASEASYTAISLVFRATAQLVIIALAAMLHELTETRSELGRSAMQAQREHLTTHLRDILARPLVELAAVAATASASVTRRDPAASALLADVSHRSRALLARTRSIVASYRHEPEQQQLLAAGRLLRGEAEPERRALVTAPIDEVAADRRRATGLLVLVQLPMMAFLAGQSVGAFDQTPGSLEWLLATLGTIGLGSWFAHHAASGSRPPASGAWLAAQLTLWTLTAAVVAQPPYDALTTVWFVAPAVAIHLSRRPALAAAVTVTLVAGTAALAWFIVDGRPAGIVEGVWFALYLPMVLTLGAGGLYAAAAMVRVVTELSAGRDELAAIAAEQERRRVSRDLHDALGQTLSAISLKSDLAIVLADRDPARAAREADEIRGLAAGLSDDLARVASDDRLVRLPGEVAGAAELLRSAGIQVEIDPDLSASPVDLDPALDSLLGWAVREGSTNVLRHSAASTVRISRFDRGTHVGIEVVNDGVRRGSRAHGSGLAGLTERAQAHGGEVTTELDGEQFLLRVAVPATGSDPAQRTTS